MNDVESPDAILKREMNKINLELLKSLGNYQKTLSFMLADAPIGCLCLPKTIETILLNEGCLRIYDLFDRDFTEIEGLGVARIRDLTTCLDKFFSMS